MIVEIVSSRAPLSVICQKIMGLMSVMHQWVVVLYRQVHGDG